MAEEKKAVAKQPNKAFAKESLKLQGDILFKAGSAYPLEKKDGKFVVEDDMRQVHEFEQDEFKKRFDAKHVEQKPQGYGAHNTAPWAKKK